MASNINIRTFMGGGIKIYLSSIAKLRLAVFKDYPFLCKITLEEELAYLRRFAQNKDSIAVLVFDGPKIVGAAIGAPLESQEPEFIKLFQDKGLNPASYFYFGQSVLLEPYRGRGLGHHFFDMREQHAKHLKRFTRICFVSIVRTSFSPAAPKEHSSLVNLWEKSGYIKRTDLTCVQSWKDSTAEKPTPKTLVFWTKEI